MTNTRDADVWAQVRSAFDLERGRVNFAGMAISPHHRVVRREIDEHRDGLDRRPWPYLIEEFAEQERKARAAIGAYFQITPDNVALTDGTTMGLAIIYAGLKLRPGQEILTSTHEFSVLKTMLEARRERDGTAFRAVRLFTNGPAFDRDELLQNLAGEIRAETRVVALTWVYSNSGVRIPVADVARRIQQVNARRAGDDHVLLSIDGVHGFGVIDATFDSLGCAFFAAGCHKWIHGPRGTGVLLGREPGWSALTPVLPSFSGGRAGHLHTPGGVHSYENRWALDEAFEFLGGLSKPAVEARITSLATTLKNSLSRLPGVTVYTPMDPRWSAGVVCFDVLEYPSNDVVKALGKQGVDVTESSKDGDEPGRHVRASLSIFNNDSDIRDLVSALKAYLGLP